MDIDDPVLFTLELISSFLCLSVWIYWGIYWYIHREKKSTPHRIDMDWEVDDWWESKKEIQLNKDKRSK